MRGIPQRSRRPGTRAAAALATSAVAFCALAGTPGSLAGASALGKDAAATKVYIAASACTGRSYKPRTVVLACADGNLFASGLRYTSYGSRQASAEGLMHLNDCTPNCAQGRFRTRPGSVRFSAAVRCADGHRYFTRARYKFGKRSGTADIEPSRCKAR
jgi:hypothetical protein